MPSVDLSNPNLWSKKYLPSVITPNIYNILWGSAGSGKSQTMIQFFLMEIMDQSQNQEQTFFVIRKVAATLRNSVYQDFKNKISESTIDYVLISQYQNTDFIDQVNIIKQQRSIQLREAETTEKHSIIIIIP